MFFGAQNRSFEDYVKLFTYLSIQEKHNFLTMPKATRIGDNMLT